jgi:DNA-binding response OmpR family regulator
MYGRPMTKPRILLVDDDASVRDMLQSAMEGDGFEVVKASNVTEALKCIVAQDFDVLLSDLHMPNAGDGFTVVSAMHHAHPQAVTLVLSGYPELQEAMSAIRMQADEVLVKPMQIASLKKLIHQRLDNREPRKAISTESVADILERDFDAIVKFWMGLVEKDEELTCIPLTVDERTGHLPKLIHDLIVRLRLPEGAKNPTSIAAHEHGMMRRKQGYTIPMVVEESRIFQVSIFHTLNNNLSTVDFSKLLLDVITIADEVDSQLKQAALCYVEPKAMREVA